MLDKLLYELDDKKIINVKNDVFRFIGIGMGGFILQSYCKANFFLNYFNIYIILIIHIKSGASL